MRVLEIGGGLDLGEEALATDHRGQFGLQHFDGDLAIVPDVVGQIDGGHPTCAEFAFDDVPVCEGRLQSA